MHKSFHVIDNFYAKPEVVRELALTKGDWMPAKSSGGITYSSETRNYFYTEEIAGRFADVIGREIAYDLARMGFGVFALHNQDAGVQFSTHYDDTEWAAVVYLTPNELCEGGLSFLRHKETGLCGPPKEADLARLDMTAEEFERDVYYPDKMHPDAWEEVARVPMRFNRAVVMHGSRLFHRANSGFGESVADGRLSQRFFFNVAGEAD